jgi:hypothetical protein
MERSNGGKGIYLFVHGVGNAKTNSVLDRVSGDFCDHDYDEIIWNNALDSSKGMFSKISDLAIAFYKCSSNDIGLIEIPAQRKIAHTVDVVQTIASLLIPIIILFAIAGYLCDAMYAKPDALGQPENDWRIIKMSIMTFYPTSWGEEAFYSIVNFFVRFLLLSWCLTVISYMLFLGGGRGLKFAFKNIFLKTIFPIVIGGALLLPVFIVIVLAIGILLFDSGTDQIIVRLSGSTVGESLIALGDQILTILPVLFLFIFGFVYLFRPLLKVLSDIFLYISNETYRSTIQSYLHEYLKNSAPGKDVTIVGHSLGSLIVLDSLLHDGIWKKANSINLVTMGSPIKRGINRFFPSFLPAYYQIPGVLSSSFEHFSWKNIYRPFDPVGTKLSLPNVVDVNTQQYYRWLIWAHVAYFRDGKVSALVKQGCKYISKPNHNGHCDSTSVTVIQNSVLNSGLHAASCFVVFWGMIVFIIATSFMNHRYWLNEELESEIVTEQEYLKEYTKTVDAKAYVWWKVVRDINNGNINYFDRSEVTIVMNIDGRDKVVTFPYASINKSRVVSDFKNYLDRYSENQKQDILNTLKRGEVDNFTGARDAIDAVELLVPAYEFKLKVIYIPKGTVINGEEYDGYLSLVDYPLTGSDSWYLTIGGLIIAWPIGILIVLYLVALPSGKFREFSDFLDDNIPERIQFIFK